ILYMLACLGLIALVVALEAWPVARLLRQARSGAVVASDLAEAVAAGGGGAALAFAGARRRAPRAPARLEGGSPPRGAAGPPARATRCAPRGDAIPAALLDGEQRLVRERQEPLQIARVVGVGGDAEAGGQVDELARAREVCRLPDPRPELPGLLDRRGP